jgi:hypothetical protein
MITIGENLDKEHLKSFENLLDKTISCLVDLYKDDAYKKANSSWEQFQTSSFHALTTVQKQNEGEIFSKWVVELVGGKKFPDIVLDINENKKFGVEVKTTKNKSWTTLGGSIMESTRVQDVQRISVLLAKMNPIAIRHKYFEDCASDVAVTHSPRYLIDFDVAPQDTIFKKIKVDYSEVWKSNQPFEFFRKYFMEKAKKEKNGVWWIGNEDERDLNELPGVQIQFFSELPEERKKYLIARAMLLYPHIFINQADYREVAVWFFNMGIINSALRDTFSAGSNIEVNGVLVPKKYIRLEKNYELILKIISNIESDIALEAEYETNDPTVCLSKWQERILGFTPGEYHPYINKVFFKDN